MSSKSLSGGLRLGLAMLAVCSAMWGQAGTPVKADEAQAAVSLVTKLYTANPLAKVGATGKPLPKQGSSSVRPAQGEERVPECEAEGAICDEVVYKAGQPEISCGWTVLFPAGGGAAKIVGDNEASATYMLRVFKKEDQDQPPVQKRYTAAAPLGAKLIQQTGRVTLNLIVDTTGKVAGVEMVSSTDRMFIGPAIVAAKRWVMTPYALNGQPRPYLQEVLILVPYL